jgi:16S rRNA (guanine527-N7)-methyltransferase
MEQILKYFSGIDAVQKSQFAALADLYAQWNQKINVISRKDIDFLYLHHVLHSLAVARLINFAAQTTILDAGTGGGFPAIPLAILFPHVNFTAIDATGKKIMVASEISKAIALQNITFKHLRLEDERQQYDFVVSRAVMPLNELVKSARKNISKMNKNALPNGIISFKGGELQNEITPFKKIAECYEISDFFDEEYFKTKKLIYLPL